MGRSRFPVAGQRLLGLREDGAKFRGAVLDGRGASGVGHGGRGEHARREAQEVQSLQWLLSRGCPARRYRWTRFGCMAFDQLMICGGDNVSGRSIVL